MTEMENVKNKCIQWIRDFFDEHGSGCNAVIGISGGKDSSIAAALCVEALGKDRVIGVLMPNGRQADIGCSHQLVTHLGIKSLTVDISAAAADILGGITAGTASSELDFRFTDQTRINLLPRIRMTTLYAVSQSVNGRVVNTSNLSETWIGYSTRYGDGAGDFSPLSNVTATEVKEIGHLLKLPKELVEKPPADGLTDQTDEDHFGFSYETLDRYLRTGEIGDLGQKEKIDHMHRQNLFKGQPMPCFPNPVKGA